MEIWHLAIQKMANVKISEAPNFGRGPGGKEETEKDSEHISHSTDCLSESSKPTLRDSRRGKQVQILVPGILEWAQAGPAQQG